MLGTLSVGSLAYYQYGPEASAVAEMIDHAASLVAEFKDSHRPDATMPAGFAAPDEPALFETTAGFEANSVAAAPRYDASIQQASALQPVTPIQEAAPIVGRGMDSLERERLTAPLLAVGATRADITSWGRDNERLFRVTASTPVGDGSSGLQQRFDAVGETPELAVAQLVREIRTAAVR